MSKLYSWPKMRSAGRIQKCLQFGVGRTYRRHVLNDANNLSQTWARRPVSRAVRRRPAKGPPGRASGLCASRGGRASSTMLSGPSAAHPTRVKLAPVGISVNFASSACAPRGAVRLQELAHLGCTTPRIAHVVEAIEHGDGVEVARGDVPRLSGLKTIKRGISKTYLFAIIFQQARHLVVFLTYLLAYSDTLPCGPNTCTSPRVDIARIGGVRQA